jgi:hypothetical protein
MLMVNLICYMLVHRTFRGTVRAHSIKHRAQICTKHDKNAISLVQGTYVLDVKLEQKGLV